MHAIVQQPLPPAQHPFAFLSREAELIGDPFGDVGNPCLALGS